MNCKDVNLLLDTLAPEELRAAERRDIEGHLASCEACRDAWAVYDEIAAQPIPETPRDLHRRIAKALDEQEPSEVGRVRRSLLTGGALVVGAALASTLTLGLASREPCALEPEPSR